ncbi:hypothetical protein Tco_0217562 [Tanacetum coccineum]
MPFTIYALHQLSLSILYMPVTKLASSIDKANNVIFDERRENRVYVGNHDMRIRVRKVILVEAQLAKENIDGKLACGRPLVVCLAREKYLLKMEDKNGKSCGSESKKSNLSRNGSVQVSQSAENRAIEVTMIEK